MGISSQFHPETLAKHKVLKTYMYTEKEFMPNELNAKHYPHAYDVDKIDWDNDMSQINQTYLMLEKGNKFNG